MPDWPAVQYTVINVNKVAYKKYYFIVRTASRCRRAYILPLWFFFVFLFSFLTPNLWGHWTDLSQTRTHIHLSLLFEKFGPNSPRHLPLTGWGQKTFLGPTLKYDRTYLCNGTGYQESERKLSFNRDSPTCRPYLVNFGPETAENGWRVIAHPLNFCIGRHCQPDYMDVIIL